MVQVGLSLPAAILIGVLSGASLIGLIGAWLLQQDRAPDAASATAVASGIVWGGSLMSWWSIGLLYLPSAALLSFASLAASRAAHRKLTSSLLLILIMVVGTIALLSLMIVLGR